MHIDRCRALWGAVALGAVITVLASCAAGPAGQQAPPQASAAPGADTPAPLTRPARPARFRTSGDFEFTVSESVRVPPGLRADYDAALGLLQSGRLQDGIEALEAVAAAGPQFVAPHLNLGIAYLKRKDYTKAEGSLKRAYALAPEHPVVANELGVLYRKTGRFDLAREHFEAALHTFPNYHRSQMNLGVLCDLFLHDLVCALDNYQAYQRAFPNDKSMQIWIADVEARMATGGEQ